MLPDRDRVINDSSVTLVPEPPIAPDQVTTEVSLK